MKKPKVIINEASADFTEIVNLLAVLTEATNQLAELKATADSSLAEILDDLKADYAKLQETVTKTESALEAVARSHPEWFEHQRTIKTPYGSISFRSGEIIEVPNEEATIVRIKLEALKLHPGETDAAIAARQKYIAQYVRSVETVNKEALEILEDATLHLLGVKRVPKDNFSAKPASLDLGKAVKESLALDEKEAA
jgi:hypothetical protein